MVITVLSCLSGGTRQQRMRIDKKHEIIADLDHSARHAAPSALQRGTYWPHLTGDFDHIFDAVDQQGVRMAVGFDDDRLLRPLFDRRTKAQ